MPAASLRALLAHSIDYAGLFPPADLALEPALRNQAAYARSPDRWMLGAFIMPIRKFAEARAHLTQFDREHPLQISALGPKTAKAAEFRPALEAAAKAIKEFLGEHEEVVSIRQFEMPLPPGPVEDSLGVARATLGDLALQVFWEAPADDWDAVINTNLRGTFLCTKEVTRFMLGKGIKGKIINIASLNSWIPSSGIGAYCASKGGVLMFTRTAALELGPRGINVNAIAPGTTMTPVTDMFYNLPGLKEDFLERTPLGRFGLPEDIGKVALFLASGYADWVTGQTICVDGGQSLMGLPLYLEGYEKANAGEG